MSNHPRLQQLQQVMAQEDVDLVVLWPSANWAYLVGHAPIAVERPTFLMVSQDHVCAVVPAFDHQEMIDKTGLTDVFAWSDAQGPQAAIKKALHRVCRGKSANDGSGRHPAFWIPEGARTTYPRCSDAAGQ